MQVRSFSIWLATCSAFLGSSTQAFSTIKQLQQRQSTTGFVSATASSLNLLRDNNNNNNNNKGNLLTRNVASVDTITVAEMERGVGGRIEAAFEAAKEKKEAAFVTFITAGYPAADGKNFLRVGGEKNGCQFRNMERRGKQKIDSSRLHTVMLLLTILIPFPVLFSLSASFN